MRCHSPAEIVSSSLVGSLVLLASLLLAAPGAYAQTLTPLSQLRETQVSVTDETTGLTCLEFGPFGPPTLGCPVTLDLQTPPVLEAAADFLPFASSLSLPTHPGHSASQDSSLSPTGIFASGATTSHGDGSYTQPLVPPNFAVQHLESGIATSLLDLSFQLDVPTTFSLDGTLERTYITTPIGSPAQSGMSLSLSQIGVGPVLSFSLPDDPACVPDPLSAPPLGLCTVGLILAESGALPAGDYQLEVAGSSVAAPFMVGVGGPGEGFSAVTGDSSASFDLAFTIEGPVPTPTPTVQPTATPTPTPLPTKKKAKTKKVKVKKVKAKIKKAKKSKKQKK